MWTVVSAFSKEESPKRRKALGLQARLTGVLEGKLALMLALQPLWRLSGPKVSLGGSRKARSVSRLV